MINWEDLKHIHVIRKLEQILAQWFYTEIFFMDERGNVKNYDPLDRQRQFKNPFCATLLPHDQGRELILKHMSQCNEKAFNSEGKRFVVDGPVGCEKVIISPIVSNGEYLGSVYAYCFIEKDVSESVVNECRKKIENLGLDGELFEE